MGQGILRKWEHMGLWAIGFEADDYAFRVYIDFGL